MEISCSIDYGHLEKWSHLEFFLYTKTSSIPTIYSRLMSYRLMKVILLIVF